MRQDSFLEFSSSLEALRKKEASFAMATVVKVHGSSSARVGSKAIFDETGKNIFGWVGGGCAERFVGEQAVESLREKKGRIVLADLDDEIFGLGIACGGKMEIFIDPITPLEKISMPLISPAQKLVAEDLAHDYSLKIVWEKSESTITSLEDFFIMLSKNLAAQREKSGRSLRDVKDLPAKFGKAVPSEAEPMISILGRGRIVEAVSKHFNLLNWKVRLIPPEEQNSISYTPGEFVVIAGHSARDPMMVKEALQQKAAYVGMVGSRTRALEVITHLENDLDQPVFIPAGLDIGAKNPAEMALSIISEVLKEKSSWT